MRNSNFGLVEEADSLQASSKPTVGKYFTGFSIGVVVNILLAIFTGFLTVWLDGFYYIMGIIPVLGLISPRAVLPKGKDIMTSIICALSSLVIIPVFTLILYLNDITLEILDNSFGLVLAIAVIAIFAAWLGFKNLNPNETKQ